MALSRNQATVLLALEETGGELSGLELADVIGTLGRSSVYAALNALQRDGLVEARWNLDESHPRKMISLNGAGKQALADLARSAKAQQQRARQIRRQGEPA